MSFILQRLPQICKDSIIDVVHRLVPTTISALKSRRNATLLCNDVKTSLLCDTTRLQLRTRRAIYLVKGKSGLELILAAKDLKASRHGWEKLLRRRNRVTSTSRGHRSHHTKLALSPVSQPPCASPHASSHPAAAGRTRAQVVTQRHAQLWQAKMRILMQRRKEVYRNVCNVLGGHKAPSGPMKALEPAALETPQAETVPMEDVQPAPLVYCSACSRSPTSPTMSWFCRNLSQARPAQPARALPPLPPDGPVPLLAPMPPSRRAAPAHHVRRERQPKPVFWGGGAGSARAGIGCGGAVVPAPSTTMTSTTSATTPRGPRRIGKPAIRDRDHDIVSLTVLPRTPFKPRRFGGALGSRSQ